MTRKERYSAQLSKLEEKRGKLLRSGRFAEAAALTADIKEIESLIKQADAYEEATRSRPITELLSREEIQKMGLIPLMIECHLVADFLTETAYMIVDTLHEHGFDDVTFMPEITELIKRSEKFAGGMAKISPELCDLVVNNETFNASLHKKYLKYIGQRLK